MIRSRKELTGMEMSLIISKKESKMRINYGIKMKTGQAIEGGFQMNKRPSISAVLDHLFRLN